MLPDGFGATALLTRESPKLTLGTSRPHRRQFCRCAATGFWRIVAAPGAAVFGIVIHGVRIEVLPLLPLLLPLLWRRSCCWLRCCFLIGCISRCRRHRRFLSLCRSSGGIGSNCSALPAISVADSLLGCIAAFQLLMRLGSRAARWWPMQRISHRPLHIRRLDAV